MPSDPLRSAVSSQESAWLIELGCSPPKWWTGRGADEWTPYVDGTPTARGPKADHAMRFARREDAERALGYLVKPGVAEGCKVTEHLWLAPASASPSPENDQLLINVYEMAKDHYGAQCFGFTGAPESMLRSAHEAARDGFDAICKKLVPTVMPLLKAEWEEANRQAKSALPASASPHAKGEDWQPISTAPKDRLIDVWWRDLRMPDVKWQADWREWSTLDGHILYGPTHWRLRPDPPSARPASLEAKPEAEP